MTAGEGRRRGRKAECAHMTVTKCCRLALLTMATLWRVRGETPLLGDPSAFGRGTIRRGKAVLTLVTSLLSPGQILEYQ